MRSRLAETKRTPRMTNHKHASEDWLETAKNADKWEAASAGAAFAQVHATLALVDATLAHTAAMERIARDQQKRAVGL